jgi:hypothetical protein
MIASDGCNRNGSVGLMTTSSAAAEQVAQLCLRLSSSRDPLSGPGPMHDLATVIAARLRAGASPGSLASDLDRLDDLLLRAGYAAGLGESRLPYAPLPGSGDGHPVLEVLACPGSCCPRVLAPGATVPECGVLRRPMRRVTL